MADLTQLAAEALAQYGIRAAELHAANADGDVFVVNGGGAEGKRFLKLVCERDGTDYLSDEALYHTYDQLVCEMEIMERLQGWELDVARPIANRAGGYVTRLNTPERVRYALLTTYIAPAAGGDRLEQAYQAGVAAGRLHSASEGGLSGLAKARPPRRMDYLDRVRDTLRSGVERHGTLRPDQLKVLLEGADLIERCMRLLDRNPGRNLGLVHTDLRYDNFVFTGSHAVPIDFTRSVYGYHLYDLGEMCAHMGGSDVQRRILAGYDSVRRFRPGEYEMVQVFLILFLLMLIAERIDDGESPWFIDTVDRLCRDFIPKMQSGGHFDASVAEALGPERVLGADWVHAAP